MLIDEDAKRKGGPVSTGQRKNKQAKAHHGEGNAVLGELTQQGDEV